MSGVSVSSGARLTPGQIGEERLKASADQSKSAADFLDGESERAKQALIESLQQAKDAIRRSIDPKQIPEKHPILTVTGAVFAGFVTALVAIPSREQQELRRLAKLHRAMHPESEKPRPAGEKAAEPKGPWWLSILHEVIQLARPLLTAVITAKVAKPKPAPVDGSDPVDAVPPPASN
jgi:hypothetical protein